jgi:hypothetical protein
MNLPDVRWFSTAMPSLDSMRDLETVNRGGP